MTTHIRLRITIKATINALDPTFQWHTSINPKNWSSRRTPLTHLGEDFNLGRGTGLVFWPRLTDTPSRTRNTHIQIQVFATRGAKRWTIFASGSLTFECGCEDRDPKGVWNMWAPLENGANLADEAEPRPLNPRCDNVWILARLLRSFAFCANYEPCLKLGRDPLFDNVRG